MTQEPQKLREEAEKALKEAERIESLESLFPDLKKETGRWGKVVYSSPSVNTEVTDFESRHNCGCCRDSPLEIWPYIDLPGGNRVHSSPAQFFVGERNPYGSGNIANPGWEEPLRAAGIPEEIIKRISYLLTVENEDGTEE